MKKVFSLALVLVLLCSSALAADYTGVWTMYFDKDGALYDSTVYLSADGSCAMSIVDNHSGQCVAQSGSGTWTEGDDGPVLLIDGILYIFHYKNGILYEHEADAGIYAPFVPVPPYDPSTVLVSLDDPAPSVDDGLLRSGDVLFQVKFMTVTYEGIDIRDDQIIMHTVVENTHDMNFRISTPVFTVNGWDAITYHALGEDDYIVPAHAKSRVDIIMKHGVSRCGISSADDIETITMNIKLQSEKFTDLALLSDDPVTFRLK